MTQTGKGLEMRNGRWRCRIASPCAPELNDMLIDNTSPAPLAAFLRALNEDYS